MSRRGDKSRRPAVGSWMVGGLFSNFGTGLDYCPIGDYGLLLLIGLVANLINMANTFLLGRTVDTVFQDDSGAGIGLFLGGMALCFILSQTTNGIKTIIEQHKNLKARGLWKWQLLGHVYRLPYLAVTELKQGEIMTILDRDTNAVSTRYSVLCNQYVLGMIMIVITFTTNALISVYLVPLMVLSLLANVWIAIDFGKRMKKYEETNRAIDGEMNDWQLEKLKHLDDVYLLNRDKYLLQKYVRFNKTKASALFKRETITASNYAMSVVNTTFVGEIIPWIVGGVLFYFGEVSLGTIVMISRYLTTFQGKLHSLAFGNVNLQKTVPAINRLRAFLSKTPERERARALPPRRPASTVFVCSHRDAVSFADVSFRYAQDTPLVIDSLSFSIKQGEKVAIFGASGIGKSTILSLVAGELTADAGSICIGGKVVAPDSLRGVRNDLSLAYQNGVIFEGSLGENIAFSMRKENPRNIAESARKAELGDLVEANDAGLSMPLDMDGRNISGGQKQRVILARAFARNPKILLLDEPTSALDADTERRVLKSISEMECTVLLISHRESVIPYMDRVLYMYGGKLHKEPQRATA